MNSLTANKIAALITATMVTFSYAGLAASQVRASDGGSAVDVASDTGAEARTASAPKAVSSKEQRKLERKQARAKKNAELKKLEDAGYKPGQGFDPNYPQGLQNAQKKVGAASGASQ